MRGFIFYVAASALLFMAPAAAIAGNDKTAINDEASENAVPDEGGPDKVERLDSVVVSATRAGKSTPVTYTMVGQQELRSANPINSVPMILNLQPSVVTYNEGGTGLGNSNMTIRGSKGSQINVTLNGVTLNDAESQEVFWVNIPSLANIISSIQVQRGLGTTANGAGAFGASVNMSTASVQPEPFAAVDVSAGSWNTFETTVAAGTGLTKSGFYANAAYSRGYTDGYIRNAKVKSQSAFVVLGWMNERNSLRMTWLMGHQRSGITWDGIDLEMYEKDRRYNDSGEYYDEYGNVHYYDNSIDAYDQNHLQLNYTHSFSDALTWTTTLNYTRGDGYDEYYKEDKDLVDYGFPSSMDTTSDIIYRKQMGNDFYVVNSDLKYNSDRLNLVGGVSVSKYDGDHWGEVLWAAIPGDDYDYSSLHTNNSSNNSWYWNNGTKYDYSAHARAEYLAGDIVTLFGDIQYRHISLKMKGVDDDYMSVNYDHDWDFLNPRAGINFQFSDAHRAYFSVALGHREPGRSDIKENVKGDVSPMKPEKMLDFELGYNYTGSKFSGSANIYFMEYKDMLIETGRLSSSGYAIKENVSRGWRRGIELVAAWTPASWFRLDANATLSINQLKDYTDYAPIDWGYTTKAFDYGRSTMLMSPSVIGMARIAVTPWKNSGRGSLKTTTFSIDGKYIGKQYLDNTERDIVKVPGFFVSNLSIYHGFNIHGGILGLTAYVNNLLNNKYYASGWRYENYDSASQNLETYVGVYPQAITNFMLKVSYRF
jgi:iron complex outermembrane receptor protein